MKLNIARLPKDEIIRMSKFRCIHKHSGLEHPQCWQQENKITERIGYLDIETSGLQADFSIIFCYCIKESNGKILGRALRKEELRNKIYDKELTRECISDMKKFDTLVYYYGDRFDIPTLRTRAVYWGLEFPLYKEIKGVDVYPIIKNKFNLHRNRLETACDFFKIPCKKHRIQPQIWFEAWGGEEKSLNWILSHCKEDVISLENLYKKVIDYSATINKSI